MINKRDIVTSIILSIVTCGIYGIFWFISITDDARIVSGDDRLSGGKCFLLTLVTCGIYGFYWAYLMGKAMMQAKAKNDLPADDNADVICNITNLWFGNCYLLFSTNRFECNCRFGY